MAKKKNEKVEQKVESPVDATPVTKSEDESLDSLLGQLQTLLKSAEDDSPDESSEGSSAPSEPDMSAEGPASAPTPAAADAAASAPTDATPDMSESGAAAAAAPEGSPQHESGEIEPAPTVEGLAAEYAKLDPESLKMHYLACKQTLMAQMGGGMDAGAPPSTPAAPPEMSGSAPAPAMKSEADETMLKVFELFKSELATIRQEQSENKKFQEDLLAQIVEVAQMPVRKSITSLSEVKKAEPAKKRPQDMTRDEVSDLLVQRLSEGKLTKAEGRLATQFTLGQLSIKDIEHLLGEESKG